MIELTDIQLSLPMLLRIDAGEVSEQDVLNHTQEAFDLLLHPILLHYNNEDLGYMKKLLESGLVDVNALAKMPLAHPQDEKDELHAGLLHVAAIRLKPEIITLLCTHGANPNASNSEERTPLYNVAIDDLERSYPYNQRIAHTDHAALAEVADALIDAGANPDIVDYRSKFGAMHYAIGQKGFQLCEHFMKRGANCMHPAHQQINASFLLQDSRSKQVHAATFTPLSTENQEALDDMLRHLNQIHRRYEKDIVRGNKTPPISNTDQAIAYANIGQLSEVFASSRWTGHEQKAIDMILSLPSFICESLQPELESLVAGIAHTLPGATPPSTKVWRASLAEKPIAAEKTRA